MIDWHWFFYQFNYLSAACRHKNKNLINQMTHHIIFSLMLKKFSFKTTYGLIGRKGTFLVSSREKPNSMTVAVSLIWLLRLGSCPKIICFQNQIHIFSPLSQRARTIVETVVGAHNHIQIGLCLCLAESCSARCLND